MKRLLLVAALLCASPTYAQVSQIPDAPASASAPVVTDTSPPPAIPDQTSAAPPAAPVTSGGPTINVQSSPWWVNAALLAFLTSSLTGFFTYRQGMRKQADDVVIQRDNQDLNAIQTREATVAQLLTQITGLTAQLAQQGAARDELIAQNAANKARLEEIAQRESLREARERELISKVSALEEKVKHLDTCAGGSPCPLANLRS